MFERKIFKFTAISVGVMVLLALTAIAAFACPLTVKCDIDGQDMYQTQVCTTVPGQPGEVCKFSHKSFDGEHYVYVRCAY